MALCVILHEAGHLIVCAIQKRRVFGLMIEPLGLKLAVQTLGFSYLQDLAMHLGGPAASFLSAGASFGMIRLSHGDPYCFFALYFNLFLGAFQLIPFSGSDGANALFSLCCERRGFAFAERAGRIAERVSAVCMLAFGVLSVIVTGFHLSVCVFFLSLALVALPSFFSGKKA